MVNRRFPFNTEKLIFYLIAVASQYKMITSNVSFVASMTTLGIGSYLLIDSMTKIIKDSLNALNVSGKNKRDHLQMFKQLSEFIQLHSKSKQLNLFFIFFLKSSNLELTLFFLDWFMIIRRFFNLCFWFFFSGVWQQHALQC